MIKEKYPPPYTVKPFYRMYGIFSGSDVVCGAMVKFVAEEICSILNAHFAPKTVESDPGGICDKCLSIHSSAYIGRKCISSKDCGGTVQDIATPQPNRKETDRVAMEFIKSERTIQPQYWEGGQWHNAVIGEGVLPPFDYGLPWRIKPTKRRVVVEVYKDSTSEGRLRSVCVGSEDASQFWTLVGTIECEVEA